MALLMMIAFTYLPSFVTMVFRGMPNVWRGRHRLYSASIMGSATWPP